MKICLCIGIYCLALVPAFLHGLVGRPRPIGLVFLAIGVLLNGLALRNVLRLERRAGVAAAALCSCAVALLLPYPQSLGPLLFLVGVSLAALGARPPGLGRLGIGLALSGIILSLQSSILALSQPLLSRHHEQTWVAAALAQVARLAGAVTHRLDTRAFILGPTGVFEVAAGLQKTGILFWGSFLFGLLPTLPLWEPRRRLRALALVGLSTGLYAVLRYVMVVLLYAETEWFPLFWSPWAVAVSFLPLLPLIAALIPLQHAPPRPAPALRSSARVTRPFWPAAGMFVAVLAFVAGLGLEDPGRAKRGRVLIDEAHSDWEKTTRAFDTEWYGEESTYNYYCLRRFLDCHYDVSIAETAIAPELLQTCDVLILKTPTRPFGPDEITAIVEFVEAGGGLYLIGDHTNVFGTSSYLNPVAREFRLRFNYDGTYDLESGGLQLYRRPGFLPHPIVQRLPPFLFATSCTLRAPMTACSVITGRGLRSTEADYGGRSFFNRHPDLASANLGSFVQLAAARHGRGRVLAFTDSTVFSNFGIFVPGKPELLLASVDWLDRVNRWPAPLRIALPAAVGILLIAWILIRCRRGAGQLVIALWLVAVAVPLAGAIVGAVNSLTYRLPQPQKPMVTVAFETEHSSFELPITSLRHDPSRDFHTFYVWAQRLGYVPRVCGSFSEALGSANAVVVIRPVEPFTPRELTRAASFVEQGGCLIVMDSPDNAASTANVLCGPLGLTVGHEPLPPSDLRDLDGEVVAANRAAAVVTGGTPVLFAGDDRPVLAFKRSGTGIVLAMADARLFANSSLGPSSTVPDERQRRLYEVVYRVFRQADPGREVSLGVPDRLR